VALQVPIFFKNAGGNHFALKWEKSVSPKGNPRHIHQPWKQVSRVFADRAGKRSYKRRLSGTSPWPAYGQKKKWGHGGKVSFPQEGGGKESQNLPLTEKKRWTGQGGPQKKKMTQLTKIKRTR